ncbi:hypothetical protein HZB88_00725 [archaeon]|nr:hypothetical protein [archaeon]
MAKLSNFSFKMFYRYFPVCMLLLSLSCGYPHLNMGKVYSAIKTMEKAENEKERKELGRLLSDGRSDCDMIDLSSKAIKCFKEQLVDEEGEPIEYNSDGLDCYDDGIENAGLLVWEVQPKNCRRVYTNNKSVVMEIIKIRSGFLGCPQEQSSWGPRMPCILRASKSKICCTAELCSACAKNEPVSAN